MTVIIGSGLLAEAFRSSTALSVRELPPRLCPVYLLKLSVPEFRACEKNRLDMKVQRFASHDVPTAKIYKCSHLDDRLIP